MASILPSLRDRRRNRRNGDKRFVGKVLKFDPKPRVIVEVYGDTLLEMRRRKMAIVDALAAMENT